MKFSKIVSVVFLVLFVMTLTGCFTIDRPMMVTSNRVGSKVGEASGQLFFGVFGDVQAGARTAAAQGGITKISTVDYEVSQMLGIITIFTTTVTGD